MIKKILFVGNYDKEYNRTKVIISGFESLNIEVIHLYIQKHNNKSKELIREWSKKVDFVFLPSFTHLDVKFVKKNINKPLVFDPLISRYLTKVFDYKKVSKYSLRAYKNYLKDKIAFKYSDIIIADTKANKKYFIEKFKLPEHKVKVVPVGVDIDVFKPIIKSNKKFIVGFYGGFIPLQGVRNIISAAKLLVDNTSIIFRLIGNGYEYEKIMKIIKADNINNIELLGWVNYEKLPEEISEFDICLGVFGDTPKTEIVIPNKIFHYAACNRAIITKDTEAIKELFTDNENIFLTSSEPKDIADKILSSKENIEEVNKISEAAFKLITNDYNAKNIATIILRVVDELLENNINVTNIY